MYSSPPKWHKDLVATHHISPNLSSLNITDEYKGNDQLSVASGQNLNITHTHISSIPTNTTFLHLNNILRIAQASKSLLSIHKLTFHN